MKTKKSDHLLKNNRGQFLIEAVLLMVVMVSFLMVGMRAFRDGNVLGNLFSKPWEKVSGMIESGNWEAADSAAKKHPNQRSRFLSYDPTK